MEVTINYTRRTLTPPLKKLHPQGSRGFYNASRGFSLFELVVFIISVAIIYAAAANRFAQFPAQAERANFIAITTQLQSSLNLEMMAMLASGRGGRLDAFEGVNPMDLLLRPPSNYLGAFINADSATLDRRSWYFDLDRQQLIYLVNDVGGVFLETNRGPLPTDEIRFEVRLVRNEYDDRTGLDIKLGQESGEVPPSARRTRFSGIVLQPVVPYIWGGQGNETELMDAAIATN